MYRYDDFDSTLVTRRVAQFRDQTQRFLRGELSEDEFRPLRLQNGLYIQKHAPMLRVAIPYGLVSAPQLRTLAQIARQYDRGYGHFTTRQNIQYNWPTLESVPDILALLATVEMHAIQTSGNCVRNITSDPLAGVAADEIVDPRPWCELMRQWSTLNPEFAFLPRKFKIAVTGATTDRTAALRPRHRRAGGARRQHGEVGFRILVGGGQGRTPMLGYTIREFLPAAELLNYFDAILRVYNLPRAARQHLQGADQDPREGTDAGGVHPPGRSRMGARARRSRHGARKRNRAARRPFRRSAVPRLRPRQRRVSRRDRRQPAVLALGRAQRAAAQAQGLRDRHAVAQAHRNAARRRDRRGDGRDRRSRRALQLRRGCASPTSRTWCSPTCCRTTCMPSGTT